MASRWGSQNLTSHNEWLILVSDPSDPSDHFCYHLYRDFGIWCSNGVSYSSRSSIGALHSIDVSYAQRLRLWHHRGHAVAVAVSRSGWAELPYHQKLSIRRVCKSLELLFILTTVYGLACKFDTVVDLKELQIRKSSVLPNDCIRIRFEL